MISTELMSHFLAHVHLLIELIWWRKVSIAQVDCISRQKRLAKIYAILPTYQIIWISIEDDARNVICTVCSFVYADVNFIDVVKWLAIRLVIQKSSRAASIISRFTEFFRKATHVAAENGVIWFRCCCCSRYT